MTTEEIRELIQVVHETGIAELEVQRGENRVRITRAKAAAQEVLVPTMVPVSVAATPVATAIPPAVSAASPPMVQPPGTQIPGQRTEFQAEAAAGEEDNGYVAVKSPIVGTYYDAPSPGAPPFVRVGDRVEPKQVLCIIESMKLMNEIEAEVAGTLIAKLVDNGRPVEYGETLFTIRPFTSA